MWKTMSKEWEDKPQTGRNIYKRHIYKELLSKGYIELLKINNKKTNKTIQKWGKIFTRHLVNEDTEWANKNIKICPTSLSLGITS